MKHFIIVTIFLISIISSTSINAQVQITGYVIEKKDNKIYLDLGNQKVKIGDRIKVIKEGGVLIHPVTGEKIKEEDEIVSYLEVKDVKEKYSIATPNTTLSYELINVGMKVYTLDNMDLKSPNLRKSIVVQPLTVTNVQGFLGMYISDVLTEQLLVSDKFKVLDRSTLGLKTEDILLSSNGLISQSEFLKYPNASKADYYISGTMYEPDVVEVSSGIPVKNLVKLTALAVSTLSGKDISKLNNAAEYLPDKTEFKNLRAIVKISLRIIDVKTGEILFICTDMQEANGKSEVNMEGGVLNGLKVRGGAATFGNTITGEATKICLDNLIGFIFQYFDGKITTKNFTGNIIELSRGKHKVINQIIKNQFIIFPYIDNGHIRIGESNNGNNFEYCSNGKLKRWRYAQGNYIKMEEDKSYIKLYDIKELESKDTIFVADFSPSGFLKMGYVLYIGENNSIKYQYQNYEGKTFSASTKLDKVFTIKKEKPLSPYIHSIYSDSLYTFYYEKENEVYTVKAVSNLNSGLMSHIEFNNLLGTKITIDCSNRDLYPLNETFDKFRIKDEVHFFNKNGNRINGNIIGYDPLLGTISVKDNLNSIHDIYYKDVLKNTK